MKLLGITKNEFKEHLQKQMPQNHTFMSYGLKTKDSWNIDHIIPVSDITAILATLCHYTNLRPSTIQENSSKEGANRMKKKEEEEVNPEL